MSNTTERETSDLRELQRISNTRVEELRNYLGEEFISIIVITGGGENSVYAQMSHGRASLHLDFATYGDAIMIHPDCAGNYDEDGKWWGHLTL